jgi:hypothetical protein
MRAVLLLALLICCAVLPVCADTGTYEILDYRVALTPHSDGKVAIDYYQKWRVTGGHIPWITVGLPNGNFEITKSGLAAASISPQSEGGWDGVRIDLARDYQPGETFEISFSVSQSQLFYADDKNYGLDFSPGWYDHAVTDSLTIRLKVFVNPESITAEPGPTSKSDQELVWSGMRLGKGERFTIHISFPKATLPQALPEGQLRNEEEKQYPGGGGVSPYVLGIGLIVAALFIFFVVLRWLGVWYLGNYSGGGLWYGGSGGGGAGGGRETGGGGGFGGSGFSCVCACACVSCACACACAGGGGAGCGRKHLRHTCPKCDPVGRAE